MAKVNGHAILFGTGPAEVEDDPTGIGEVAGAAEAEYDAALDEGAEIEPVPEMFPEDVTEEIASADPDLDAEPAPELAEDEAGEEDAPADVPVEPVVEAPAYKYASQAEAERANAELQRQLNEQMWRQQNVPAPAAPAPTPTNYQQLAQTDPISAFNQALEAGDSTATTQVTTQVANEAVRMAQAAWAAREEGDEEAAARHDQAALSANQLAEEMRGAAYEARYTQHVQQQMEPVQAERVMNALNTAASAALSSPVFEGIELTPEQHQQIGQVLEANPQVFGDRSPAALAEGFKQAAVHVVFGGQEQMIAHMVDRQVQAALAANPQAPPVNKSRGMGGGVGRSAPLVPQRQAADAEIQDIQPKRPNGMNVLFNTGG